MVETSEPFLPLHVTCPLFKQIRCHPCVVAAYSAIIQNVGPPNAQLQSGCFPRLKYQSFDVPMCLPTCILCRGERSAAAS